MYLINCPLIIPLRKKFHTRAFEIIFFHHAVVFIKSPIQYLIHRLIFFLTWTCSYIWRFKHYEEVYSQSVPRFHRWFEGAPSILGVQIHVDNEFKDQPSITKIINEQKNILMGWISNAVRLGRSERFFGDWIMCLMRDREWMRERETTYFQNLTNLILWIHSLNLTVLCLFFFIGRNIADTA